MTELQLKEVVRNDPLYLELLDKYISLCEEMDHRRTMLALQ